MVSEPNYHTMNYISEDLSIIEMKRRKVKMNKPIYLGLSILDISKILMYKFWYDYMKPKYGKVNRPLPTGKNKKVIGSMKDEIGGGDHYGIRYIKTKNLFVLD